MNPSIFEWERRDYRKEPTFSEKQKDLLWMILGVFVFSTALWFAVSIIVPDTVKAAEPSPYPLTNKGSCERIRDEHMPVTGASTDDFAAACKELGVQL